MRNDSSTTSLHISDAKYFAMPVSTSARRPASLARAACTVSSRAASIFVAISASLNWIAWWRCSGLPNVSRSWA